MFSLTLCDVQMKSDHVSWVGQQEVLSYMCRQQVEQNPLIVQLHSLHVISLLRSLRMKHINRNINNYLYNHTSCITCTVTGERIEKTFRTTV